MKVKERERKKLAAGARLVQKGTQIFGRSEHEKEPQSETKDDGNEDKGGVSRIEGASSKKRRRITNHRAKFEG